MMFPDQFKNHIMPEKVHMLNVSFMVPQMRREFGGCAGNIAYNLQLLKGDGLPMGTVGSDFGIYAEWMDNNGIARTHVKVIDDVFTGQAFITTDLDDNQITAFHPGAMAFSHHNKVSDAVGITLGIISPDGRDGMIEHANQFQQADIPFMFDPGQGMPMFDGEDLRRFIEQASWLSVNDYEWQMMQQKTGLSPHEVTEQVKALIITRGADGSVIYTRNKRYSIPAVKPSVIADPTGCGDAFRAGLIYGLMNDMDWDTTGRIASLMGSIKIEHAGTQNHKFDFEMFKERYRKTFGSTF